MSTECPRESAQGCMNFSARDWSSDRRDAWLYGIICGWGSAIKEVAKKHGWDDAQVERLNRLNKAFAKRFP